MMEVNKNTKSLPKVLIIGHTFDNTGTGITLKSLFSLWPSDKLACASQKPYNPNFATYYKLGNKEVKPLWIFRFFQKIPDSNVYHKKISQSKKVTDSNDISSKVKKKSFNQYFLDIISKTHLYHIRYKYEVSEELYSWINNFNPDIIFTCLGNISTIKFINNIFKIYPDKKLSIYILDDWPYFHASQSILPFLSRKTFNFHFKRCIENASYLFCISEKMAEEYKLRYNKHFIPFHNPVDKSLYVVNNHKIKKNNHIITYIGKINYHNYDVINDIIIAVTKINNVYGLNIFFNIYPGDNNKYLRRLRLTDSVKIHKRVEHELIPKILINSSILVLPLSFNTKSKKYTRLSISTKLTEYLASGSPTLIYAPKDIALSEYVEKYNCGFIVSERNLESLERQILLILQNKDISKKYIQNAISLINEKHESFLVTSSFTKILSDIV